MEEIREFVNGVYGTRLLIFLETKPQSNQYHQILLNEEEFKKVSMTLGKNTGAKDTNGNDIIELYHSKEIYPLPDLEEITHEKTT